MHPACYHTLVTSHPATANLLERSIQIIVPSKCCRRTEGQRGDDVAEMKWPALSSWRFNNASQLETVPYGDRYLQPIGCSFPAIDSIAVVGHTAYLICITENVDCGIDAGLLEVLKYLPPHLEVEFIWALPPGVWDQKAFSARDMPAHQGDRPAAYTRESSFFFKIAKRLRSCQKQYKIPVSVNRPAKYGASISDVDFVSSQTAALPGTGSSGSVAAFSSIAEVTGKLQGANSQLTKVRTPSPITFQTAPCVHSVT